MLAGFLMTEAACLYLEGSLPGLVRVYALIVGLLSIVAVILLIRQKAVVELSRTYRYHYLAAGILTFVFVVFKCDNSTDSVLETAMMALHTGKLYGYSPYTGQPLMGNMLSKMGSGGLLPAFYAVLSKLSGIHVTVIGKLAIPFAVVCMALTAHRLLVCRLFGTDTKRSSHALWLVLSAWIFFCFQGFVGYRPLWDAPWTSGCLIFYCIAPLLFYLFLEKEWNPRFSALFLLTVVTFLLLFPVDMWEKAKGVAAVTAVFLILYAVFQKPPARLGNLIADVFPKKCTGGLIIPLTVVLPAVLSVIFHGCIITDSQYAMPDNRYKMDAEVMQIRTLLEPAAGEIKMLAPPKVCAQIRDADFKINLLFGTDALEAEADAEGIRIKEIAQDLAVNEYEPVKLIQHARAENCNYVVSCKKTEALGVQDADALFYQYGFLKAGETASYIVYEFIGDDLGKYEITQYASSSGKQAMFYTITDALGHLIVVDGGWEQDAGEVEQIIMEKGGKVDVWILTHPHPDHIGAFNKIYLEGQILIDRIYAVPIDGAKYQDVANWWDDIDVYKTFAELTMDEERLVYIHESDTIDLFGLTMEVFHSFDYEQLVAAKSRDYCNDGALIFKLSGKKKSMLFLSDVGVCMSDRLMDTYKERLKADYVQMGHHGNGGMSEAVYDIIRPEAAFFDMPLSMIEDTTLNAYVKRAYMQALGSRILDYTTAPNQVVIE